MNRPLKDETLMVSPMC